MAWDENLDRLAIDAIRALTMDAIQKANSGHPGAPMGLAPLGWTIFSRLRKHDPTDPAFPDRDRFVLSCGHASMLQYALLHLSGYALSLEDIGRFRQWNSLTPGHPEVHHTPGVEMTTGPLGQGLATAVGMALAERQLAQRFNQEGHALIGHHTFCIASDGDLMEGISAEAASLAGHLGLGRLIVFWDDNRITIDGPTDLTFTEDVPARFAAYGWHTASVEDGNDVAAIEAAGRAALADPRPSFVRVRTVIGYPAPTKQNTSSCHGSPLGDAEIARTKEAMGWQHPPLTVPTELDAVRDQIVARGKAHSAEWKKMRADHRAAQPAAARELDAALSGELAAGWDRDLPLFAADSKGLATRQASGKVLNAMAATVPTLVGGSADLKGSNNTYLDGMADFGPPGAPAAGGPPRNLHWGIREHAMAAAVNGMALHGGVIPFAATFLVFSDYMRPAIRLAALMGMPTRYVFTHDSIGLGEDGPTHQPIEHLAALRAIPNMTVIRPCDANETREAWRAAMLAKGPVALVLTRQALPTLDRKRYGRAEGLARGAYVLEEASSSKPDVLLLATGSEVHLALQAREQLEGEGVPTRVVSMPSWELFATQDADYRERVLPSACRVRVVIEAATRFGWERWAGMEGGYVTLERFGASAPAEELFERLGITAAAAVAEAKRLLATGR